MCDSRNDGDVEIAMSRIGILAVVREYWESLAGGKAGLQVVLTKQYKATQIMLA